MSICINCRLCAERYTHQNNESKKFSLIGALSLRNMMQKWRPEREKDAKSQQQNTIWPKRFQASAKKTGIRPLPPILRTIVWCGHERILNLLPIHHQNQFYSFPNIAKPLISMAIGVSLWLWFYFLARHNWFAYIFFLNHIQFVCRNH